MTATLFRALAVLSSCAAVAIVFGGAPQSASAQNTLRPPVQMTALPERDVIPPAMECADLAAEDFSTIKGAPTNIASATIESATAERAEFCLVKGMIAPQIQFELRLPTKTYTGRYLQGGCGGACGVIYDRVTPECDNIHAFGGAFALSFNNSGHVGTSGRDTIWAINSPQARADYAYRAAHVMAVVAKTILQSFYGKQPDYSYFQGCSYGGREGLKEAQIYPNDFDGIVAGAPAIWITPGVVRIIWETQQGLDAEGKPILTPESVALLHKAVIAACDELDGVKDGQIDDGRACKYDPGDLVCASAAQTSNCISAAQAKTMRAYYRGPVDDKGRNLYLGAEPYGSELNWAGKGSFALLGGPFAAKQIAHMIYNGEPPKDFDWRTWKPDEKILTDLFERGGYYNASNPDLSAFKASGGKLLIWQGDADNSSGPNVVLDYYQRVRDTLGGFSATQDFMRVFMVPGVYHCRGGYIPYEEDFLGAMVQWVEKGRAPDSVLASARLQDGIVRTRPVYAYPTRAKYKGTGDINRPESFAPERPQREPNDLYPWLGAGMKDGPAPTAF